MELSHRSGMEHSYFGVKRVSVPSHCTEECEGMKICLWFFFPALLVFTHIIHSPWLFPLRAFLGSCCWGPPENWWLQLAVPRHELNGARGVVCLELTRSSAEWLTSVWCLKDGVNLQAVASQVPSKTKGQWGSCPSSSCPQVWLLMDIDGYWVHPAGVHRLWCFGRCFFWDSLSSWGRTQGLRAAATQMLLWLAFGLWRQILLLVLPGTSTRAAGISS